MLTSEFGPKFPIFPLVAGWIGTPVRPLKSAQEILPNYFWGPCQNPRKTKKWFVLALTLQNWPQMLVHSFISIRCNLQQILRLLLLQSAGKIPKIVANSKQGLSQTPSHNLKPKFPSLCNSQVCLLQALRSPCVATSVSSPQTCTPTARTLETRWNSLLGLALEVHRSKGWDLCSETLVC